MEIILEILLALSALFFVGSPLFWYIPEERRGREQGRHEELLRKKEAYYRLIKEAEMDYRMGKLSQEDYQTLAQQYKQEAISVLKELEGLGAQFRLEQELEQEIQDMRRKMAKNICPQCRHQVGPSDNFCPQCGYRIKPEG